MTVVARLLLEKKDTCQDTKYRIVAKEVLEQYDYEATFQFVNRWVETKHILRAYLYKDGGFL